MMFSILRLMVVLQMYMYSRVEVYVCVRSCPVSSLLRKTVNSTVLSVTALGGRSCTDLLWLKSFPDVLHFCMLTGQTSLAEREAMEMDNPLFLIIP